MNRSGSTLLSVVFAAVILAAGIVGLLMTQSMWRDKAIALNETIIAESYATELLEFFRSFTDDGLRDYLSKNPINGNTTVAGLYKFCSHINLLDRTSGTILNGDPVADLPPDNRLDARQGRANRFYQVHVVNIAGTAAQDELIVRKDLCARTAKEIYFYNRTPDAPIQLGKDEKLFVSVGVSWMTRTKRPMAKRIVLSTFLPDKHE